MKRTVFVLPLVSALFAVPAQADGWLEDWRIHGYSGVVWNDDSTDVTFGVSGRKALTRNLSVGPTVEFTPDVETRDGSESGQWLVLGTARYDLPLGFHANGGLGAQFFDGDSDFVARVGGGYALRLGGLSVGPTVTVDFVDGDQRVFAGGYLGLNF